MPVQHLRLRARCCQRAGRAACHFAISFAIAFKAGFSILNAPENLGFAGKPHDAVSSFLPQLHRKEAMLSSMCSISEGYEDDLCQDAIVTFSLADADRVGLGIVTAQKTIAPLVLIAQDPGGLLWDDMGWHVFKHARRRKHADAKELGTWPAH
eukprot:TRINITY_DN14742_c0_g2_i1.p1 TRINITY_DN14742_c0_g2~~TRINITY_DN14742_c0_g2_i1.p1  ORF type:complete len:153 (+),score=25.36 TRINITY_DN14742_c0_g2_i1:237-695(+)